MSTDYIVPTIDNPCTVPPNTEELLYQHEEFWIMQHADDRCTQTHGTFDTILEALAVYPNATVEIRDGE